jgi:hypothetical protein
LSWGWCSTPQDLSPGIAEAELKVALAAIAKAELKEAKRVEEPSAVEAHDAEAELKIEAAENVEEPGAAKHVEEPGAIEAEHAEAELKIEAAENVEEPGAAKHVEEPGAIEAHTNSWKLIFMSGAYQA